MADKAAESSADLADGPAPSKLPMILAIVNSVALLAAAGTAVYTKVLFKRPAITEPDERARLAADAKNHDLTARAPETVVFESMTINIAPSAGESAEASGDPTPQSGKVHYLTIALSVVLPDAARKPDFENLRPLILDKFLSTLGRKQFHELNSIQGRYLLRTELLEAINGLDPNRKDNAQTPPLATEIYFTQFIVQ